MASVNHKGILVKQCRDWIWGFLLENWPFAFWQRTPLARVVALSPELVDDSMKLLKHTNKQTFRLYLYLLVNNTCCSLACWVCGRAWPTAMCLNSLYSTGRMIVPNVFQEWSLPCAIPRDKEVHQPFNLFCSSAGWWHFQKGLKADDHALQYHNS